jgi:hypothetical protein
MEDLMSEQEIIELVEEAKKPGKFNIMDVVKERAFPEQEVNVYLDEQTAYLASDMNDKIKQTSPSDNEYAKMEEELSKLLSKLEESKYVFTIRGISEAKRDEVLKLASDKYPIEYREEKNTYTGEVKREEIEDQDRNNLFTSMLWSEHIIKIVSPDGSVQDNISPEDVKSLRGLLPLASSATINRTIEKIRAASAIFMMSVDEDFLAKS